MTVVALPDRPGAARRPGAIVLTDARTDAERDRVAAWARETHPGAPVVHQASPTLPRLLREAGDPLLVPARVTWMPPEPVPGARPRIGELLLLADPGGPLRRLHGIAARRNPDRARVVAGEPAHLRDLQRRFRAEAGRAGSDDELAAFVARQATLAAERAERAVIGDRYKVPRLVAEQITASGVVRERVTALAHELERSPESVMEELTGCLAELATVQSRLGEQLYRVLLSPMHSRAWTVDVDVDSLERLREANRGAALVFLPSHRSYVDPLVLNQVMHDHDFPRNHLLGGDNMSFGPIGALGKRAGVIFIRRSFGSDRVYKLAVREYLGHLVAKRFNLEWYPEGGRTRTGKLRPPRLGLLHYLTAAVEEGRAPDVLLVPTSIVYDQLHEIGATAAEQTGAQKRREGMGWMVDYVRAQRTNMGKARVRFGEPVSLKATLDGVGDGAARLHKVGFAVMDGINRATPVTSTSLVGFAMLGVRDRALTLRELQALLAPLLDHLERADTLRTVDELRRPAALRATLDALTEAGIVRCYDAGLEPVWKVDPDRHHEAAFYRNGALHHLVHRAIVELALLAVAREQPAGDPIQAAFEDALAIRDLLKFEFFFPEKDQFRDNLYRELDLIDPDWRDHVADTEVARAMLRRTGTLTAHRALRSFFDAQLVVARRLAEREPREPVQRDAFLQECVRVGRQLQLQGLVHGPESVSRELYGAALDLAANRDLVDPGREALRRGREAFLAEIEEVLDRVRRIGEIDDELLQDALAQA
ncbi:glycerol-3-phosphate 1-O-acyltransferase [Paraconexibacter algicola]|uniref:glycerol-3-phosphate 1-O-acyltransferase n=1 Tax=Paraconexibacter algicola TaxID=2133960 RepID=UPI0018EEB5CB|nr:glycerol-3-phosphate 1-O-acyltransferase [Paraconexibacter algicola]